MSQHSVRVALAVQGGLSTVCATCGTPDNMLPFGMPYRDPAAKTEHNKTYREKNPEQIKATQRKWNEANKDKLKEDKRIWHKEQMKDPEYRKRNRDRAQAWAKHNPERHAQLARSGWLRRKYGIDAEEYDRRLQLQGGGCALCCSKEVGLPQRTFFFVDHDHETGRVRGLLCNKCNLGLSMFRDQPEVMRRAALYLERPQQ